MGSLYQYLGNDHSPFPSGSDTDLGSGCGYLVEAANRWGLTATGLEGSDEAIEMAKLRVPTLDIRPHRLSEHLPFQTESHQTIVLNQVIEHLEKPVAAFVVSESLRVLGPGGMLLITAPSSANTYERLADPTHINLMSPAQLRNLLTEAGYERITPFDHALPIFGKHRLLHGACIRHIQGNST